MLASVCYHGFASLGPIGGERAPSVSDGFFSVQTLKKNTEPEKMNFTLLGLTRQPEPRRLSIRLIHVPTSKPLAKRQPVQPTPTTKPKPIVPDVANVPADVAEFFRSLDLASVPSVTVVEMSPNTWEPLSRPL